MSELVQITEAQRALALVETPAEAKDLYDRLETLSQYAKRYGIAHDKQNEIAEAKLRTARKGGDLLGPPRPGERTDLTSSGSEEVLSQTQDQGVPA